MRRQVHGCLRSRYVLLQRCELFAQSRLLIKDGLLPREEPLRAGESGCTRRRQRGSAEKRFSVGAVCRRLRPRGDQLRPVGNRRRSSGIRCASMRVCKSGGGA